MPNHVTHRVIITGPEADLAAFESRCIELIEPEPGQSSDDDAPRRRFNFNSLIPMPPSLGIEAGSVVSMGLVALGQDDPDLMTSTLAFYLSCPWAAEAGLTDLESFRAWVEAKHPNAIPLARQAIENMAQHGHTTWYGWCIDRWGTKWNSYDFRLDYRAPGLIEFRFDTAWSVPRPVLAELAKTFPSLAIRVVAFDEGWCFAARGFFLGGRGEVEEFEADEATYAEVHGEWSDLDDEEDADEETSSVQIDSEATDAHLA